ncbi:MAG: hypothetical protein ACO1OC_03980 [Tuberibacillus sp.]
MKKKVKIVILTLLTALTVGVFSLGVHELRFSQDGRLPPAPAFFAQDGRLPPSPALPA